MITLITGVPGSGKSLLAIEILVANWKSQKMRPAFTNINGVDNDKLKTFELVDPRKWFELPEGSIIVIDECQKPFPVRASGSAVPEWISEFETHRHKGFDIFLVTQHPSLMDKHLRKLVGLHQHCYRPFGMDRRTVFEWNTVNEDPEPNQSESNAVRNAKPFDKSLYGFYKSAEIHTHKKRLPWKKILTLVVVVVLVPLLLFMTYVSLRDGPFNGEIPKSGTKKVASGVGVITAEGKADHVQSGQKEEKDASPNFAYRGYFRIDGTLRLLIEDTITGETFDISDFDGYQKKGVDVMLFVRDGGGKPYSVRSAELAALLP